MQTIGTHGFRLVMLAVLAAMPGTAHAYLDAGTGSMILQLLLGGVAGLAIAGKLYWHKLLLVLGIRKEPAADAGTHSRVEPGE